MNQNMIGQYLRTLRMEKGWTQAQLAEKLNVSNRSVSRWETGSTMPDLSLLIELSELYEVSVDQILDAGQKKMKREDNSMIAKVADYNSEQEMKISRKLQFLFAVGLACMVGVAILDMNRLLDIEPWATLASVFLGLITGILLTGLLYTSRYRKKIAEAKARLLHR